MRGVVYRRFRYINVVGTFFGILLNIQLLLEIIIKKNQMGLWCTVGVGGVVDLVYRIGHNNGLVKFEFNDLINC